MLAATMDFFGTGTALYEDYLILKDCVRQLGNEQLMNEVLDISNSLSGQKIIEYAKITQSIAISKKRGDVVESLQMAHLVY